MLKVRDDEAARALMKLVNADPFTRLEALEIFRSLGYEIVKKEPTDAK